MHVFSRILCFFILSTVLGSHVIATPIDRFNRFRKPPHVEVPPISSDGTALHNDPPTLTPKPSDDIAVPPSSIAAGPSFVDSTETPSSHADSDNIDSLQTRDLKRQHLLFKPPHPDSIAGCNDNDASTTNRNEEQTRYNVHTSPRLVLDPTTKPLRSTNQGQQQPQQAPVSTNRLPRRLDEIHRLSSDKPYTGNIGTTLSYDSDDNNANPHPDQPSEESDSFEMVSFDDIPNDIISNHTESDSHEPKTAVVVEVDRDHDNNNQVPEIAHARDYGSYNFAPGYGQTPYYTYSPRDGDVNYDLGRSNAAIGGDAVPAPTPPPSPATDPQTNYLPTEGVGNGVMLSDYEGPAMVGGTENGHPVNTMINELLEDLAHRTRNNVENELPSHRAYHKYTWSGRYRRRRV